MLPIIMGLISVSTMNRTTGTWLRKHCGGHSPNRPHENKKLPNKIFYNLKIQRDDYIVSFSIRKQKFR